MPTVMPRNARPPMPADQPRCAWKTMGKAAKHMYSVPYRIAM